MKSTIHWYVLKESDGYLRKGFRQIPWLERHTDSLTNAERFTLDEPQEHGFYVQDLIKEVNAKIIKVEQEVTLTVVD